jgi:type IV pilus assembly protein PilV
MIGLRKNTGFSLVEVLVTIIILMIGLLGLAGLQGRAMTAQMESYQRSQALILVRDMADRINANRVNAVNYITTTATQRGTGFNGSAVLDCAGLAGSALDLCEWHNALLGAAEKQSAANVGAMIGARGCVYQLVPSAGVAAEYIVAVAWQGFNNTVALTGIVADCGSGQYGDDANRRVVTLPISMANLD